EVATAVPAASNATRPAITWRLRMSLLSDRRLRPALGESRDRREPHRVYCIHGGDCNPCVRRLSTRLGPRVFGPAPVKSDGRGSALAQVPKRRRRAGAQASGVSIAAPPVGIVIPSRFESILARRDLDPTPLILPVEPDLRALDGIPEVARPQSGGLLSFLLG